MRHSFSLLFWINKSKTNKNGDAPIYARVTVDGERAEIATGEKINIINSLFSILATPHSMTELITSNTLRFLKALRRNNNREWFETHKSDYQAAKKNVTAFAEAVQDGLNQTDLIAKCYVYRIYRDLRFTKDRTHPYKRHLDAYLYRAGDQRRGGYVFRIAPGGDSQAGGGFFGPDKEDLLRIRQELAFDSEPIRKIVSEPNFVRYFGQLAGDAVKTAPRGFDPDQPGIEWIRKKQFYALRSFSDEEVLRPDFVEQTVATFRALRPFFDYMSEVLTTNADGEVE